eukprot:CAMPEP_0174906846 /NCGR_PEP_ID=MMETSP0167-20121228/58625_1 /TAXON_ID=38298 /ORGANISM="Rhodella maculata, Strain CCMP736" /LENGTH=52 /DNA_ID=CAMNT_0016150185 /DNA_START=271 /DNA_END=426 /DNA_ORIENTATION=+
MPHEPDHGPMRVLWGGMKLAAGGTARNQVRAGCAVGRIFGSIEGRDLYGTKS